MIVAAFSEGEDLSDWTGATYDEVAAEFPHRDLVLYNREKIDQCLEEMMKYPHFYDQVHQLWADTQPEVLTSNRFKHPDIWIQRHFMLHAIQGWWQKVFPSTYGIYIQLTDVNKFCIFMMVQRGRISFFHEPDLSGMIPERRKYSSDVIKYLSGKYMVPVQGFFLPTAEWTEWSEMSNPWPKIFTAIKSDRNKLVPFKWTMATLIGSRAHLGF